MKIKDTKLVAEIRIKQVEGNSAWMRYQELCSGKKMTYNWSNLGGIPDQLVFKFRAPVHPGFTLVVMGYPMPTCFPGKRGLTRREAQSMLRNFGLEPLSTIQTIQIAAQTIVSGQMLEVCRQNDARRIVATPPIQPEAPGYFYFGAGSNGRGSFRHFDYQRIYAESERDNLYFWHHNGTEEKLEVSPNERYHFPLLLGVREQPKKS